MASSVTGVGSISSAGIGSGLDVATIVTRLMSIERLPLTALQTQASDLGSKLSVMGTLKSNYAAMQTKANALVSPTLWNSTTASASDSTVASVATSTSASAGSYQLAVNKLASTQTVIGAAVANSAATFSAGSLTIELGSYGDGSPATDFTPKSGAAAVTISIGDGDTSLTGLRDKINSSSAGVSASIVTDASGSRLSLRSRETGSENAFRINATETRDDGNTATGLSALVFDATQASSAMQRTSTAGNADLTLNGIAISSASNTLTNVVDGLTLSLQKTTAANAPVTVTVKVDTASVKTAITEFVTAFNTLASYIHTQTAYNADSKVAGQLQGDQGALGMQSQLRGAINQGSTASSTWGRLSEIGFTLKTDGTLDTNAVKLDNALGNLTELRTLLTTDASTAGGSGFVRRFKSLADAALGSDGAIDTRNVGLQSSVARNTKAQDSLQLRLTATEARIRAQYTALDTQMATLNATAAYVRQQFTSSSSTA